MYRNYLAIAGLALAGTLTSQAPLTEAEFPASPSAVQAAASFQKIVQPAKETRAAIKKVTALRWHKQLSAATREAKKQEKPILWIQAYGALKGFA